MPLKALTPCRKPGCPALTRGEDNGFCKEHRREAWRFEKRDAMASRPEEVKFYLSKRWKQLRAFHLATEPMCRECRRWGRLTLATVVDHVSRVRDGGDRWDVGNLQSLCAACHNVKRAREAHG